MPLSEDEQRILQQIEQNFYENDPEFAREVGETTLYRHAWRNIKWALFGVVVGVGVLVTALSVHYLFAFVGFLIVFACTVVIERNSVKLGRAGLAQVTGNMRSTNMRDAVGGIGSKLKRNKPSDDS